MIVSAIREFLRMESASGILLLVATASAMLMANSPLAGLYQGFLDTPVAVQVGELKIAKPLLLWINDGLMAVFFFLVGLELKREVLEGELSKPSQIVLPAVAAMGGMAAPALIYSAINWGNGAAMNGWAIPSATDIAFALGVLTLLGDRVPNALKIFLLTLAMFDDLGAIIIIALFYSGELSTLSLSIAAGALAVLAILNRRGVTSLVPYLLVGLVLWVSVLKSGVHATLAGVLLAFFIPLRVPAEAEQPPLRQLEHDLHPSVAFGILPLFAFANAGISLEGISFATLLEPVPLGIAAGLFLGNQIGIMLAVGLVVFLGLARLPQGVNWRILYGMTLLCGIGFTMSLFVASLAFEQVGTEYASIDRLGILVGSVLSALAGYVVLNLTLPRKAAAMAG